MQTDLKAATAPLSDQDAARFLTQATLGYTREDIARVQALGPAGWIEEQFQAPAMTGHCEWLLKEGYADPANIDDTTGLDAVVVSAGTPGGCMPSTDRSRTRWAPSASVRPIAAPATARARLCRITIQATPRALAPSAMRTASSGRRRLVV